jgi:hypothetical protein
MISTDDAYNFVFRGLLTKEAVDAAIQEVAPSKPIEVTENVETLLSLSALDERFVSDAREMSLVYVLIAAFENSVRESHEQSLRDLCQYSYSVCSLM